MDLKDKKVLVIGLGRSGFYAAHLAKTQGAKVFVTESACDRCIERRSTALKKEGIEVEVSGHTESFTKDIDFVIISPGVNLEEPFIKEKILNKGIHVISEIELAFSLCPSKNIIAVTGTNGKSTTVRLIGHLLISAGKKVVICGNIGQPFAAFIRKIDQETLVVLEISSYQL